MATEVKCNCSQWKEWSESIFMAQVEHTLRTGIKYTGKQWEFCPWCGNCLESICPRCEGKGKYQRLGFSPTDCAVCDGSGWLEEVGLTP